MLLEGGDAIFVNVVVLPESISEFNIISIRRD